MRVIVGTVLLALGSTATAQQAIAQQSAAATQVSAEAQRVMVSLAPAICR